MNVKDIMTRSLQTCTLHDNLATVAMRMWESDCGALPVKNHDGQVIGMITDRDICMAAATKHHEISDVLVWETITGDIVTCHAEDDISTALDTMAQRQVRRLPVVDDDGLLHSILSMNDVILECRPDRRTRCRAHTQSDLPTSQVSRHLARGSYAHRRRHRLVRAVL